VTTLAGEQENTRSGPLSRYRSALGRPDLRRLLGALLLSATGSWAYNVAMLAFVFERTHSLHWVAAAGLARFVPQLLLSTYAGVIAERTERVRLLVGSDLLSAVFQAGLAAVAATGGPPSAALGLAALTAVSNVVYSPATAATIPSIADEDELAAANALNGTIDQLVVIAGPAIGSLLLVIGTPALVFAINAATFLGSAALVSTLSVRSRPVDVTEGGSAGPLRQMLVGLRTLAGLPTARTLAAYSVLASFVYGTDTILFVAVSAHRLGTGANGFGYLLAGLGVGGVLMAGAVDRLAGGRRLGTIILIGMLGYALPTALLTVIRAPALAFAVEVVRGGATLIVDVLAITALQRTAKPDQLARVFGVFFALVLGAIAVGAVITPVIVSGAGLTDALWAMSLGPAAIALIGYPALLAMDRQTAATAQILAPRVAVLETLGLFAGASRPTLEQVAAAAVTRPYARGIAIVVEGEPADALYVLTEGRVQFTARGEAGGEERVLRVITAPGYFGEIGVLEGIPRTATARAFTNCVCERIDGSAFLEALTAAPPSAGLVDTARSRLALTHPSRPLRFDPGSGG
jgi:hypothetical protein